MNSSADQNDEQNQDADLFKQAMSDVRPLPKKQQRPLPDRPRTNNQKQGHGSGTGATTSTPAAQPLPQPITERWLRSGHSPVLLTELRGERFHADEELDLHQLNSAEARRRLRRFLDYACQHHCRTVRIIHGRGLHSQGHAILPELVQDELRADPRVLAFRLAGRFDGGSGALRVRLKSD